jgi:hypothetical protein
MPNKHWHDKQVRDDKQVVLRLDQVLKKFDRLLYLDVIDTEHVAELREIERRLIEIRNKYVK